MNTVPLLLHHVRRLAAAAAPDDQLLADYLARHDETAFAALVGRHGPMVLNLCRRILRDPHAAEDAFQATFLVLAARAPAIRRRVSLAGWLYGVAYRLAVRAKRQRAARARPAGDLAACGHPAASPPEGLAWQEMLAVLDQELRRLSDRLRAPLVLCYLEGQTQDEAARLLGWSVGTLRRRLEEGRRLLEARLRGRGVTLSAALGGLLAAGAAAVPAQLRAATLAAVRARAGQGVPGATAVASTANLGGRTLIPASVRKWVALAVGGLALGFGIWAHGAASREAEPADPPQPTSPAPAPAEGGAAPDPVFRLAAEAVTARETEPRSFNLLLEVAVQEAQQGNAAAARKRFQQAADRLAALDGYTRAIGLVQVAYRLADAGDRAAAAAMLEEARRLAPAITAANDRNEVLRFAAVCHGEKIDPAQAIAHARDIPDENCRLNALRDIAVAQAEAGDVPGARSTVELIRTPYGYFKLNPLQAIAAAQLKAGDRAAAAATLREALAVVEQKRTNQWGDWLASQVEVLVHYAAAQARAGDRAVARATLERVEQALAADSRPLSLEALITLARAGVIERPAAERAVQRYLRAAEASEDDETPRTGLVLAQLALGDFDGAAKTARRARDSDSLRHVCVALAEAGRTEAAVALARAARTDEARAWGLLGAARGVLNRTPPGRLPRYAGTLAPTVPPRPAAPPPTAAPDPDPRQEMQAAVQKWEQAWAKFNERLGQVKSEEARRALLEKERPSGDECAGQLLGLARKHPGERVAFEALAWIVEYTYDAPAAEQALTRLRQDHLSAKKIGDVCTLAVFSPHYGAVEQLMRTVLEKSPHTAARGQACLALAQFLRVEANRAQFARRPQTPEEAAQLEQAYGPAEVRRRKALDPAALQAEAERLYERVLAEFADVHPPRQGEPLGTWARAALDEIRLLAVGKTAPEIEGEDLDGKPLKLSDHRGKVVVLTFWASWCGPCRAMIPQERELVKRLAGRPFVLLGVSGDEDRDRLRGWLARNPLPWPSWWDGRRRIARAWNVSAWPTVYVLDPKGVIRYRDVTGRELDEAADALLKEAAAR
jgi:RNA polymerase sigma factor (sigma-70 family)